MPKGECVLLYIEKQAVVQVTIRMIAQFLDMNDITKIQTVSMCVCVCACVFGGLP